MAANSMSHMQEIQVNRDGFLLTLYCTKDVADMLMSTTLDPTVKELIVNGLLDMSQHVESRASTSSQLMQPQTSSQLVKSRASTSSQPVESRASTSSQLVEARASTSSTSSQLVQPRASTSSQLVQPRASTSSQLVQPRASTSSQLVESRASTSSQLVEFRASTSSQLVESRASTSPQPVEESLTSTCKNHGVIHQWTATQEDMLVSVRHERATDFLKNKNHAAIWKEISIRLNNELGSHINAQQAINKYNNLKKRWKEIIDSKSGSETKYFRQRDAFDEAYGTRASTKPSFVIDSGSNVICCSSEDKPEAGTSDGNTNKVNNVAKNKKKTLKRKSTQLVDLIKEQEADFKERMEHHHQDKMSRMDRLLDLYERDINSKTNNTGDSAKD